MAKDLLVTIELRSLTHIDSLKEVARAWSGPRRVGASETSTRYRDSEWAQFKDINPS